MEYIGLSDLGLRKKRGRFLGVDDASKLELHIERMLASDISLTDLDSCLADCLAERLPVYDLFSNRVFDQELWKWGVRTAIDLKDNYVGASVEEIEELKERRWKDYHENVLSKNNGLRRVEKFAANKVSKMIYPGVKEYFELMEATHNTIVTRNIRELTIPFANHLGIDTIVTDSYDREKGLTRILPPYSHFSRFTFIGDHTTFQGASNWMERYKQRSVTIYVSPDKTVPEDIADNVHIHIGRDFTPLNALIKKMNG